MSLFDFNTFTGSHTSVLCGCWFRPVPKSTEWRPSVFHTKKHHGDDKTVVLRVEDEFYLSCCRTYLWIRAHVTLRILGFYGFALQWFCVLNPTHNKISLSEEVQRKLTEWSLRFILKPCKRSGTPFWLNVNGSIFRHLALSLEGHLRT
jgi:hypothetical protein